MTITKDIVIDQITILEDGTILYREATRIVEDGKTLTQTYHRISLIPGQDLTGQPDNVIAIANVVWTPSVIEAFANRSTHTLMAPTTEVQ